MGSYFALLMFWGWLPFNLILFSVRTPRQAVVFSYIFSWLFLPGIGYNLPGLPDLTKTTATVAATTLGALIFDGARVFAFRMRWYDIPMMVWCLSPFASSISAGSGAYDGTSAILNQTISWGFPYLIGRIYFTDADGAKLLAVAITLGALAYVPLCLIEIRMSPILRGMVYGIYRWEGVRYGGWRPSVFLVTGLELGMWMTLGCITAERLWASGSIKKLWGWPFWMWCVALVVTTVFCKSTGALALLALAWLTTYACKFLGKSWPVLLVLSIPPAFCAVRATGLWSGQAAVDIARFVVGDERAQSLEFRFQCEDNHIAQAMKQPILGYSRSTSFVNFNSKNWTEKIIDSYWMITLGTMGLVGVVAMNAMFLLPMILTTRRFPVRTWADPEAASTVALAMFLVVLMIDNLSNAMPNPIYAVVMGSVTGMSVSARGSRAKIGAALADAYAVLERGHPEEAVAAFGLAASLAIPGGARGGEESRDLMAEAMGGMGHSLALAGHPEEAEQSLREALDLRLELASGPPDPDRLAGLAASHEDLARLLSDSGDGSEAIIERRKAVDLRGTIVAARPKDPDAQARMVDALNDLAWLLATGVDEGHRDPEAAVILATDAARRAPENPACWNTLGVARYRSGDWDGACEALEYSVALGPPGGTAFDHYFLSMACGNLGELDHARAWFDLAVDWADRHRPGHAGLAAFRSEAAAMLVAKTGKISGQISS